VVLVSLARLAPPVLLALPALLVPLALMALPLWPLI
jgi:hypothetical protein